MASPGYSSVDKNDADDFVMNLIGSSDRPATEIDPVILANQIRILEDSLKDIDELKPSSSNSKQKCPVCSTYLSNFSNINRHLKNGSCRRKTP